MSAGTNCPGRVAPRAYHGSVRPIRIRNVELRRVGEELEVRFDMELDDLWRYPDGAPAGTFNAAWLFVKLRSSITQHDQSHDDLITALAPSAHLPVQLAEEVRERARRRLETALLRLSSRDKSLMQAVGPLAFFDMEGLAPAGLDMADLGVALEPDAAPVDPAAAAPAVEPAVAGEAAAEVPEVQYMQVTREVLQRDNPSGSPGVMGAQKEMITLVARRNENGELTFDCKRLLPWQHARLSPIDADHGAPLGSEIVAVDDGMGVFIQRSADNPGAGPTVLNGVVLRIRPSDELEFPVRVWVHALEMVYVPEGAYELGDPQGIEGPTGCFHSNQPTYLDGGRSNWVYTVDSAGAISVCAANEHSEGTHLTWDNRGQFGSYADIPASFPNGYGAFYCMRRQLTQGQFCDFINSLSGHAKTSRFPYGGQGDYRYTVYKTEGGLRAVTRPNRANSWMSWSDAISWMWWAGLRPMTELEYEKACRGSAPAISEEFAWGSTVLEEANIIIGDESATESLSGNGHLNNPHNELIGGDGGYGAVRDDAFMVPGTALTNDFSGGGYAIFGADPTGADFATADPADVRQGTGASYWGIMALTGNLWEFVISAGHERGRAFTGVHGDGKLNAVGLPRWVNGPVEEAPWPDGGAVGTGFRGGSWYTAVSKGRMADRSHGAGLEGYTARSHDTGIRGVRSATRPPRAS